MIRFFRKLSKDRRGNVLAITAACFPLVVGASGLAVDTIQWTLWKRQLQRAADSAAIAGVYDRQSSNGATTTVATTVTHDLTINQHTWMSLKSGYPVVSFPSDSGSKTNQVSVSLAVQQPLPFSSIFMSAAPTIIANATAATIPSGGTPCALALVPTATTGITNSGNTTITAPNCIFFSNSTSTNAASAGGSSDVTAKAVAAVGGIQQSNNWNVGQYLPYSPALPDPFADVTPDPADMNCTSDALDPNTNWGQLASGINCFSSLSVGSNKTLNVPSSYSGPIYINGGSVDLKGTFNCSSCTIVLTNKSTATNAQIGTFSSNAQASNNITAPTSGTYKGIAVYQDRRATGNVDKINGGSSNTITGALYFPKDTLWINGSGGGTALCTMFVGYKLVFTGNSGLKLSSPDDAACTPAGMPSGSALKMVRLVA